MTGRRGLLALGILGAAGSIAPLRTAAAAVDCASAERAQAVGEALLEKYVAAVNAHDTSTFAEIHTESYIQHSGRSPNGLAAQIENFRGIFGRMPDVQARVEDRIVAGDRVFVSGQLALRPAEVPRGEADHREAEIRREGGIQHAERVGIPDLAEERDVCRTTGTPLAVADRRANGRLTTPADLDDAIIEGASKRLRPKLMTVAAILLGLLPILVDQGPGSEALKRIAAPMAGGILVSFLMELLAYPCLYRLLHRRRLPLTTS